MSQGFDEWNPQKEAFDDKDFNSYDRGPGKYLEKNTIQLHVNNLPPHINEDGLRALFSKSGVVKEVWRHQEHPFAFVTMATLRDAESAIRKINHFKIGNYKIGVTVAKNNREKAALLQKKKEEEQFYKQLRLSNNSCKDDDWNNDAYTNFSAVDLQPDVRQNGAGGGGNFPTIKGKTNSKQLPCRMCGKLGTKRCSRCKSPYCSIECQKQDWFNNHQTDCKSINNFQNASLELVDRFDVNLNMEAFSDSYTDKPVQFTESLVDKETQSKKHTKKYKRDSDKKLNSKQISPGNSSSSQSSQSDSSPRKPSGSFSKHDNRKTCYKSNQSSKPTPAKKIEYPLDDIKDPDLKKKQDSHLKPTLHKNHEKLNLSDNPKKTTFKVQLPLHQFCQVLVTNVVSYKELYVQPFEEANRRMITYLNTEIAKVYGDNTQRIPCISSLKVGEIYACHFSTNNLWYRVQIASINGSDVTVKYIDYGNNEITKCDMMRELIPELKEIPPQAFCCALDLSVAKNFEGIDLLIKPGIKCGLPYKLKVVKTGQPYIVKLYDEDGDVGKKLSELIKSKMDLEYSVLSSYKEDTPYTVKLVADLKNKMDHLKIGIKYSVFPYHVNSPSDFMVQVVIMDKEFHQFNQKLQTCALSCPPLSQKPILNQLVLVQKAQGQWCRAGVMQIENASLTVQLLDYGSIETVSVQNVRSAPPLCLSHPITIVHSKLAEVKPIDKRGWSPKLCNIFKDILKAMNASVYVKEQHIVGEYNGTDNNSKSFWKLIDLYTNASIAYLLFRDGYAIFEEKPLQQQHSKIMVSDIHKIPLAVDTDHDGIAIDFQSDTFFINLIQSDLKEFQINFNEFLHSAGYQERHYIACENEIVAAKFSLDKNWYRGQIMKVHDDFKVTVFFIDYGNSECLASNQLQPLPKQFVSYPKQAIPCKLHNTTIPENGWHQFGEFVLNNICKYKIMSQTNETFNVIVFGNDGQCLNDMFKEENVNGFQSEIDGLNSSYQTCNSLARFSRSNREVPLASCTSSLSSECSTALSPVVQVASSFSDSTQHVTLLNEKKLSTLSLESLGDSDFDSCIDSPKMRCFTKNMSCPLLKNDKSYKLHCTSVVSSDSFYCQLLDDTVVIEQYFELMEKLGKLCDESAEEPNFVIEKGQLVAAKYSDNDWYRAKVIDICDNGVEVFFIDYGNVSLVAKENLREICSERFVEFPMLAVRCSLTGISEEKWLEEVSKFQDKTLNVKVVGKVDDTYQVLLKEDLEEHMADDVASSSPLPPGISEEAEKERIQHQIEELQRKLATLNCKV